MWRCIEAVCCILWWICTSFCCGPYISYYSRSRSFACAWIISSHIFWYACLWMLLIQETAFRLVKAMHERKRPIVILNVGATRGDEYAALKVCKRYRCSLTDGCRWMLSLATPLVCYVTLYYDNIHTIMISLSLLNL